MQERNRAWWSQNPMSYDWQGTIKSPEGTAAFFQEIDRRFFESSPFYSGQPPFAELIPFPALVNKRVLEIGCGLGAHTQLLTQAGARVTAVDITPRAAELTRLRLQKSGLSARVEVMDAEHLDLPDDSFDFVWSWGVIHHSHDTEAIVREVSRVLVPGGEFRFMVYRRDSLQARLNLLRGALTGKWFQGMRSFEILNHYSDGYLARHFTAAQISGLLARCGMQTVDISVLGQRSELLPIPGRGPLRSLKAFVGDKVPARPARAFLARAGWFLFVTARAAGSA